MNTPRRVVLVDGLTDTRDVLSAVFSERGVVVDRMSPRTSSPSGSTHSGPDVLVLEDEVVPDGWESVPRVVIGRAVLPAISSSSSSTRLPSPFQYAELVSAIESLLDDTEMVAVTDPRG